MNIWVSRFLSGLAFLALGVLGVVHRSGVVPPSNFRGHPLAAPEGGLAVEVVGWLGVFSWLLVVLGGFLATRSVQHGFATGAIQAKIAEWKPEKKTEVEDQEEAEED